MIKITPAMIESGVAAMARIKKQHPVDSSVVATVFSAMYHAYEGEQKRMAGINTSAPYQHQSWPAWRYGPDGVGKTFDKPEDVPEGWTEQPAHVLNTRPEPPTYTIRKDFPPKAKRKYTRRVQADGAKAVD